MTRRGGLSARNDRKKDFRWNKRANSWSAPNIAAAPCRRIIGVGKTAFIAASPPSEPDGRN